MIRFKDITIPKPCSVEYDALPGDNIKRFCASCEKHVYDFRGKDQAYLNEVFTANGKVCGIYYEDQIQKPTLQIQRPFYYTFATKLVSAGLFLKTILSTHDTQALASHHHPVIQISDDSTSTGIQVQTENRHASRKRHPYTLSIFINNKLYKSTIYDEGDFIYLPDSVKSTDKIKILVRRDGSGKKWSNEIVKNRNYNFLYKHAQDIVIRITYKKELRLFKRRYVAGGIMIDW